MIARIALVTTAFLASSALAAPLKVDAAKSAVGVTFKQMGVSVDAKFNKLVAQIDYDAAKPENEKASVEIDVQVNAQRKIDGLAISTQRQEGRWRTGV